MADLPGGTLEFRGIHADFLADTTPEIDLEGSLNCGKTTVALWKELNALERYDGIWSLLARWTDDAVTTKLIPAVEQLCDIRGIRPVWNSKEKSFEFENGSRAFMFGLKAQSLVERYNKIRGLPVSRIYIDQAEELPADIANELRARLRPDVKARLRGSRFPFQLTFTPNPTDTDHWLAKQFPESGPHKTRRYYSLSVFDNAHNLPADTVEGMLLAFPPDHPKHQTMILGKRGPNITGVGVYEGIYKKDLHQRAVSYRPDMQVFEAFEFGKHNPVWVLAQPQYAGGLAFLGGIFGEGMMLEDFLPLVRQYRAQWLAAGAQVRSCCGPMGDKAAASTSRYTVLNILQRHGTRLTWRENANAPDVQLAMIENIAGYLRRRNTRQEELIAINPDSQHWLKANMEGVTPYPFMHFAFEAGYVWDEHFISISNKELRQPHEDDKFANVMHCVENIELNFCADQMTEQELETRRLKLAQQGMSAMPAQYGPNAWLGM